MIDGSRGSTQDAGLSGTPLARPSAAHAASHGCLIPWALRPTVDEIPAGVLRQARLRALDLAGVAPAGYRTQPGSITRKLASARFSGRTARVLFGGRKVSAAGATFAGANMLDAFDAHDGHALTKRHAEAASLPMLAPLGGRGGSDGRCRPPPPPGVGLRGRHPGRHRLAWQRHRPPHVRRIEVAVMATGPGRPVIDLPNLLLERA